MTITSSLAAGVSGLNANATKLATIADNIANSSTLGFKRAATEFTALVVGDGTARFAAGGVQAQVQRLVDERGSVVATANATDLAITGRGFLPVTDAAALAAGVQPPPLALTSTGSFRADADGVLRTGDGRVLLGWPAAPDGTIPAFPRDSVAGLEPVRLATAPVTAQPTTRVSLGVNLPAAQTRAGADAAAFDLPVQIFDALGDTRTLDISFTPVVPASGQSNLWTLALSDRAAGGTLLGSYEIGFADSGTSAASIASVTTLSGPAYDAAQGTIPITTSGGPLAVAIGRPGGGSTLTQFTSDFRATDVSRDGSPVASLTSVRVAEDGVVHAVFENGFTRPIYQVPLVDVPNPNGLTPRDAQSYTVSLASGAFRLRDAGEPGLGEILGFAQEESTTDIAGELTQLIQTQRAYSSNATVVRTVDEMLQETTNLKR